MRAPARTAPTFERLRGPRPLRVTYVTSRPCTTAPASEGCDTYDVMTPEEDNVSPSITGRSATAACSGGRCGLTIQTRIDRLRLYNDFPKAASGAGGPATN